MASQVQQPASALFVFKRRFKNEETGEEFYNDNFINPLNILSAYWETVEGQRRLNVFLSNGFTMTFTEGIGDRLLNHLEAILRTSFNMNAAPRVTPRTIEKRAARQVVDVITEEHETGSEASWQEPS